MTGASHERPPQPVAGHDLHGATRPRLRALHRQHERHVAFWAQFPATAPELGWDDLAVERRNEITVVSYCHCGRWFTCRSEDDRRIQVAWHHACPDRNRIAWHPTPQLQLF